FRIDLDGFGPVEHFPPNLSRGLQQREDVVGRESWRKSEIHSDLDAFLAMVQNRAKRTHLHCQGPERSPTFAGVAACPESVDEGGREGTFRIAGPASVQPPVLDPNRQGSVDCVDVAEEEDRWRAPANVRDRVSDGVRTSVQAETAS